MTFAGRLRAGCIVMVCVAVGPACAATPHAKLAAKHVLQPRVPSPERTLASSRSGLGGPDLGFAVLSAASFADLVTDPDSAGVFAAPSAVGGTRDTGLRSGFPDREAGGWVKLIAGLGLIGFVFGRRAGLL